MPIFLISLFFFLVALLFAANSASQYPYTCRVDFSSFDGPIARVDIPFEPKSRSYMVIFEYKRKCEPLFAYLTTKTSSSRLGRVIQRRVVNPAVYFLTIDGVRRTWHGAVNDYQNTSEVAIGLTQQAWDSLLLGPSNIFLLKVMLESTMSHYWVLILPLKVLAKCA